MHCEPALERQLFRVTLLWSVNTALKTRKERSQHTYLAWVKGHKDIKGKEAADKLSKQADMNGLGRLCEWAGWGHGLEESEQKFFFLIFFLHQFCMPTWSVWCAHGPETFILRIGLEKGQSEWKLREGNGTGLLQYWALTAYTWCWSDELYCIVLYLQPVLNPKSYDGARVLVLEASGRPIGRTKICTWTQRVAFQDRQGRLGPVQVHIIECVGNWCKKKTKKNICSDSSSSCSQSARCHLPVLVQVCLPVCSVCQSPVQVHIIECVGNWCRKKQRKTSALTLLAHALSPPGVTFRFMSKYGCPFAQFVSRFLAFDIFMLFKLLLTDQSNVTRSNWRSRAGSQCTALTGTEFLAVVLFFFFIKRSGNGSYLQRVQTY